MEKDRSSEILEAILLINNRLGNMEERFDKLDQRFDKLEKQVELNHRETKEEFLNVKTKLDIIESKVCK